MKKITLFFALVSLSFQSNAQIAAGSVAPDFTATDINGVTHHLADYLAAGKTVVIDVSATWCGPCWNFHNSKALEDLYTAYGPEGSDEVVILFIEGDAATTNADLNGTGTNTQGNWVAGTPYPIIDGSNIGSLYQITYFPTVFRICPNGLVTEMGGRTASAIRTDLNTNCVPLIGTQNNIAALDNENSFCTTSGTAIAKMRNYGENTITTATLNLKENGNVVATKNYSGSMPRFTTRTLTFDSYVFDPTADYTVEIVSANSNGLFNAALATAEMGVGLAKQATTDIVVKVYTDNYPSEISWNIKNSAGTIVASAGPYAGTSAGGGVDANTTKIHNVTLLADDCYSINLLDSYGDGWGLGNTPHGMEIFDNTNNSILDIPVGAFGTALAKPNSLTTAQLAVSSFEANTVKLFPNPSTGLISINTETAVNVSIVDVTGKVVFVATNITKDKNIDLSGLQKGMYLARISGENTTSTEKIILN
jgi:thiol-disulfide isomerase/thioredoxin